MLAERSAEPGVSRQPWPRRGQFLGDYAGMAAVLAALVGFFALKTQYFLTRDTFLAIANQVPAAVVIAVGITFVLIIAEIDLSVGSVVGLSSAVLGVVLARANWPLVAAIPACLLTGVACGLLSGALVLRWRIPSFMVTLGMLEMARGATYLVTGTRTQYIGSQIQAVSSVSLFGLTLPALLAVLAVVAGQFVLSSTVFGRHMIALGSNAEAARLSGISTARIRAAVFMLCGGMAALGALITTARIGSADPNVGTGFELQAIAAAVIGGTSLMGGRGSVVNSFFGVLIIAVLGTGLTQMGAGEPVKRLITGMVIIAAVIVDHYRTRLSNNAAT